MSHFSNERFLIVIKLLWKWRISSQIHYYTGVLIRIPANMFWKPNSFYDPHLRASKYIAKPL